MEEKYVILDKSNLLECSNNLIENIQQKINDASMEFIKVPLEADNLEYHKILCILDEESMFYLKLNDVDLTEKNIFLFNIDQIETIKNQARKLINQYNEIYPLIHDYKITGELLLAIKDFNNNFSNKSYFDKSNLAYLNKFENELCYFENDFDEKKNLFSKETDKFLSNFGPKNRIQKAKYKW